MNVIPPVRKQVFNQQKSGYYGELGSGANARIKFVQTAVSQDELDKIALIQNIPGSEAWDVRDLFQRDVDFDRVTQQILPYLKDKNRVKYFNPLTLVLLPLTQGQGEVQKELLPVIETVVNEHGHAYTVYEVADLFKFRAHLTQPEYSTVEWNDRRVRVVAIDGQHRLSALKRWKSEPGGSGELGNWQIPVVLLGIVKDRPEEAAANVLEIVRRTFVYINSRAEQVNKSRRILLDDESVNSLCVQELVQASHANDVLPIEQRNPDRLPLLFFDWRGETKHGQPVAAPAAVKSTIELHEWMKEYLLGTDGDEKQEVRLEVADLIPPLRTGDLSQIVSHEDANRIRRQFRNVMYPGVSYLLEQFRPYRQYNEEVRRLEREVQQSSDLAKHAFAKLRFGSSVADPSLLKDVQAAYDDIVADLEGIKNRLLPELIGRDVGMRAVIGAFDILKTFRDNREDETVAWRDYATWFTDLVNYVYDDDWFEAFGQQDPRNQKLLMHVVFDPAGAIINYKVRDAGTCFGTFVALLVMSKHGDQVALSEAWQEFSDNLRVPLRRGYRKLIRADLANSFQGTPAEFPAAVNRQADQEVAKHLRAFADRLGVREA